MKCLIVFTVFLLAVQYIYAIKLHFNKAALLGDSVSFTFDPWSTYGVEKCPVLHNDVLYSVYPNNNITNAVYEGDGKSCKMRLENLTFADAGNWTVTKYWYGPSGTMVFYDIPYELFIVEKLTPLPSAHLTVEDGNYATVYAPDTYDNFIKCQLIRLSGEKIVDTYDLLNLSVANSNMTLAEKCGVRLLVNESTRGEWILVQYFEHNVIRKYKFIILNPDNDYSVMKVTTN